MARLTVVTPAALADGFRLGGAPTRVARGPAETTAAIRSLVADEEVGLVLVTEDLWGAIDPRTRTDFENLERPIVLSLPVGAIAELAIGRRLLGEMLQRAVGYRIELGGAGEGGP